MLLCLPPELGARIWARVRFERARAAVGRHLPARAARLKFARNTGEEWPCSVQASLQCQDKLITVVRLLDEGLLTGMHEVSVTRARQPPAVYTHLVLDRVVLEYDHRFIVERWIQTPSGWVRTHLDGVYLE